MIGWIAIAVVLLAPLAAMQFTDEVRWTGFDFAVAGGLLIGAMTAYEIAARFLTEGRSRTIAASALALIVLPIWADGSVGIF